MKSNGKVRPLGFKGSNPLQGHKGPFVYPCFFSSSPRTAPASRDVGCDCIVLETTNNVLRLLVVATPPRRCRPSFVVLHPLSSLGCNRISYRIRSDRAFPCMEDPPVAFHLWLFQEFLHHA